MSLKQGTSSSEPHPAILTELEELRQDRDMIRDELQQNKYKLEQLRSEYMVSNTYVGLDTLRFIH